MTSGMTKATYAVTEDAMQYMVLRRDQLPPDLRSFEVLREGMLDNETMAEHGFFGRTVDDLRRLGRMSGYLREFGSPALGTPVAEGTDLATATVVHLFDTEQSVRRWITDVFVREFEENRGKAIGPDQELIAAERLDVSGFAYEAAGIRAVQRGPIGVLSSTVIDFRVGRLLGVAYVVSMGDCLRQDLAEPLGRELERQIVRVVLGAA